MRRMLLLFAAVLASVGAHARVGNADRVDLAWDTTKPHGVTRTIHFATREGTWMSVDQSSNGQWIAFDLLGNIYRMPASGGDALNLTRESGIALNFHPAISPNGKYIAFVS